LEELELFVAKAQSCLKHAQERQRAEAILNRWAALWTGPKRALAATYSNHGAFLHFDQLIGHTWAHVFTFHAAPRHGLSMKGPDTDRIRKSHKLRANPIDRTGLDAVFDAWSARPEARPAGNAVEFLLSETSDETWEGCLQDVLTRL